MPSNCHACCRAANKAEGELVRRKAAEEAAELSAKEAAWRQKLLDMNAATKASNNTLLAFRAAERERDKQLEQSVEGEALTTALCCMSLGIEWKCSAPVVVAANILLLPMAWLLRGSGTSSWSRL
jgi:hypothetical protein